MSKDFVPQTEHLNPRDPATLAYVHNHLFQVKSWIRNLAEKHETEAYLIGEAEALVDEAQDNLKNVIDNIKRETK